MSASGKYLARITNPKTGKVRPYDRRQLWAREERELRGWDGLSGGEQRARDKFARLIADGTPKADALKAALGIDRGHLVEVETLEQFECYWAPDLIDTIADRWTGSAYFRTFASAAIRGAQNKAAAHADRFVQTLVDICNKPKASDSAKARAALGGLGIVGLVAGSKLEQEVAGEKQNLRKQGLRLLKKPKQATGTDGATAE